MKTKPEKASTLTITLAGCREQHRPEWPKSLLLERSPTFPCTASPLLILGWLLPLFTNSDPVIIAPQPVDSVVPALNLDPGSNGAQYPPVFKSLHLQWSTLPLWQLSGPVLSVKSHSLEFVWVHSTCWGWQDSTLISYSGNFLKEQSRHVFNNLLKVLYLQAFGLKHLERSDRILAGLGYFSWFFVSSLKFLAHSDGELPPQVWPLPGEQLRPQQRVF